MLLLSITKAFIELSLIMNTCTRLSPIPAAENKGCAYSFTITSTSLSVIISTEKAPLQYTKKNNGVKNLAIFGLADSVRGIKKAGYLFYFIRQSVAAVTANTNLSLILRVL